VELVQSVEQGLQDACINPTNPQITSTVHNKKAKGTWNAPCLYWLYFFLQVHSGAPYEN